MDNIRKSVGKFVAEIDENEIAAIIATTCIGVARPENMSAEDVLKNINRHSPEAHRDFTTAARMVMLYFKKQIEKGGLVN